MQIKRSAQSGFSLIELLVAITILAIGLLGLADLQITAVKANSQSQTMVTAASIAQGILEEVAAMDSADPLFNAAVDDGVWDTSPVSVQGGGSYNITYDVVTNYQGVTNLCQIIITVESTTTLHDLTGNKKRKVVVSTIKRGT